MIFLLILVMIGVASRLIEHAPNATPIVALSILAGYFCRSWVAYIVPILIIFISNLWLGHYDLELSIAIYGSFCVPVLLSKYSDGFFRAGLTALLCSCIFFITTNLAVWHGSTFYSQDLSGLYQCFLAALPFFRNTIVGDLGYTFIAWTIIWASGRVAKASVCKAEIIMGSSPISLSKHVDVVIKTMQHGGSNPPVSTRG